MKRTVYIETTIPSFYYSDRTEQDMVVVKDWTREWWSAESPNYELVSSVAVVGIEARRSLPERGEDPVDGECPHARLGRGDR